MIQRVQSLYLSAIFLLSLLFLGTPVFAFNDGSGKVIKLMWTGILKDHGAVFTGQIENIWPLVAILSLISLLSLISIFIFRNRKIQSLIALSVIILSVLLVALLSYYAYLVTDTYSITIIPGFKMAIPVLILVFSILAYRGIVKDDRLVKSYDRLR
jgi:hypothetical protein